LSSYGTASSLGSLALQGQAFLAVEPIDPLVIDPPALPAQQNMQTPVAIADPGLGQLLEVSP